MKLTYLILILIVIGLNCSENNNEDYYCWSEPAIMLNDLSIEYTDGTKEEFYNVQVEKGKNAYSILYKAYFKYDSTLVKTDSLTYMRYDTTYIPSKTVLIYYGGIKKMMVLNTRIE